MNRLEELITKWHGGRELGAKLSFSKKIGKSQAFVSYMCMGKTRPGPATIKAMAKELGVSVSELEEVVNEVYKVNNSDVNFSQTRILPDDNKPEPMYGKATGEPFRLLSHSQEGRIPMEQLVEGSYYRLEVYGDGLKQLGLSAGETVRIQKQGWALDGELVLVRAGEQEYKIQKYNKTRDKGVSILGVCREVIRKI